MSRRHDQRTLEAWCRENGWGWRRYGEISGLGLTKATLLTVAPTVSVDAPPARPVRRPMAPTKALLPKAFRRT